MSHHEEEAPKNASHTQEEHKMMKKTSSPNELNFNDNSRTGRGKGGTIRTNTVYGGETSADTRISKETVQV